MFFRLSRSASLAMLEGRWGSGENEYTKVCYKSDNSRMYDHWHVSFDWYTYVATNFYIYLHDVINWCFSWSLYQWVLGFSDGIYSYIGILSTFTGHVILLYFLRSKAQHAWSDHCSGLPHASPRGSPRPLYWPLPITQFWCNVVVSYSNNFHTFLQNITKHFLETCWEKPDTIKCQQCTLYFTFVALLRCSSPVLNFFNNLLLPKAYSFHGRNFLTSYIV